jgi:dolichol-phosphate mannosyltransferase
MSCPAPLPRLKGQRKPVTIVVPCYNEEEMIPALADTLDSLARKTCPEYDMHFVLVDDGSTDRSWELMRKYFDAFPNAELLRHERNLGVMASVMNGIRYARTEIVCSMDSDCTYDPHELVRLIPALCDGVDVVTGSPYHPQGKVLNVPLWRLALSKSVSFLYRCILRQKLSTYTSCFRVYRKSACAELLLREKGYPGVAEILGRLDLSGSRIVEHPAVLKSRARGKSKLKIFPAILGQLRVLLRLLCARIFLPMGNLSRS